MTLCAYCLNDGWVVVARRNEGNGYVDEMGPCCYCDAGTLVEFPPPDHRGKERVGPWGALGYWQGRKPDIRPIATDKVGSRAPMPPELRELLGVGLKDAA